MNDIPLDQYTLAKYQHLSEERKALADQQVREVIRTLGESDTPRDVKETAAD